MLINKRWQLRVNIRDRPSDNKDVNNNPQHNANKGPQHNVCFKILVLTDNKDRNLALNPIITAQNDRSHPQSKQIIRHVKNKSIIIWLTCTHWEWLDLFRFGFV